MNIASWISSRAVHVSEPDKVTGERLVEVGEAGSGSCAVRVSGCVIVPVEEYERLTTKEAKA